VYATVHLPNEAKMLQKIGMRDFRDNLAKYLNSTSPVAILRHGQTIGYFFPTQLKPDEADKESLRRAAEKLDKLLQEHGIEEDEMVAEFRKLKEGK
jgi:hemerythrin